MAKPGSKAGAAPEAPAPDTIEQGNRVATGSAQGQGSALAKSESQSLFLAGAQEAKMAFAQDEIAIPFFRVLQSNSPQVTMGHEKFIKDARPGELINTVTLERYDGQRGVLLFPIAFQTRYTEWVPRKKGGGFVADHGLNADVLKRTTRDKETNKDVTPEGNEIVRSANYYCFLLDEALRRFVPVLFVLAGTQLKKSRAWNALIDGAVAPHPSGGTYKPAPFYFGYRVTTVPEQNDKGNWIGVVIRQDVSVEQLFQLGGKDEVAAQQFNVLGVELFKQALEYRKLVDSGKVKVTQPEEDIVDAEITEGPGANAF